MKLLVSVRNGAEADAALAGGCDILDIKEPRRGSLGMADVAEIRTVIAVARGAPSLVPVSAALGEAADWLESASIPEIPCGLTYVKMGTSRLGSAKAWIDDWSAAQGRFLTSPHVRAQSAAWIAVAYADWEPAGGPRPARVLEAAARHKWGGVLIDTHSKRGGGLFDWMTPDELNDLARRAARWNIPFALAGRISLGDLPLLVEIAPELIGIRTAACYDGLRDGVVDATAVLAFKAAMTSCRAQI